MDEYMRQWVFHLNDLFGASPTTSARFGKDADFFNSDETIFLQFRIEAAIDEMKTLSVSKDQRNFVFKYLL